MQTFSRKNKLLIGLILLVILGSVGLLSSQILNRIALSRPSTAVRPATTILSANSNSAMFGFDLQHTHFNPSEHILNPSNVSRLALYWTAPTRNFVFSLPAVVNGVVYAGSYDRQLYAFNARTGATLWTYTTGASISSSPVVANGVVYIGSQDHKLYAFDARTGGTLWSYRTGDVILSSPTVADGVVYIGSDDGKLYAFHLPPWHDLISLVR